jgi:hypothetical protein
VQLVLAERPAVRQGVPGGLRDLFEGLGGREPLLGGKALDLLAELRPKLLVVRRVRARP